MCGSRAGKNAACPECGSVDHIDLEPDKAQALLRWMLQAAKDAPR
jgi:hypothetical protein